MSSLLLVQREKMEVALLRGRILTRQRTTFDGREHTTEIKANLRLILALLSIAGDSWQVKG